MTNSEWEKLRVTLAKTFDEDIVQATLLRLIRLESRGAVPLDRLAWCRHCAGALRKNEFRRRDRERVAKETLAALKIPLDNRSDREVARDRQRRKRRKEIA